MANYRVQSYKYTSATVLTTSGYAMTWAGSAVEQEVILSTAITEYPVGVSLQSCVQNDNIGLCDVGDVVKAVAGGSIAIGDHLTATTGGKFIKANKSGSAVNTFIWGQALSATKTGANDIITMRFNPVADSLT